MIQRPPSHPINMKLPGIEYARGLAAVMVVFYHVMRHMRLNIGYLPLGGIAQFGHAGVDFFFVLSGFIIFFVHGKDVGHSVRLPYYAQRRFTRIFPLYWAIFLISIILSAVFSRHPFPDISFISQSLFLLPTVADPLIGVAWTLQQEIIFYIIFSISIANRRMGLLALFIWLLLIAFNWFSIIPLSENNIVIKLLLDYNVEFYFGMFAAWLTINKLTPDTLFFLVIGFLLFIGIGAAENLDIINGYTSSARIAYGLSSFLLVLGLVGVADIGGRIGIILKSLGTASYSIYLTHFLSVGVTYKILELTGLFSQLPVWITYILLSASGIIGGVLASRFIEYPLMRFVKNNFFGRQPVDLKKR